MSSVDFVSVINNEHIIVKMIIIERGIKRRNINVEVRVLEQVDSTLSAMIRIKRIVSVVGNTKREIVIDYFIVD